MGRETNGSLQCEDESTVAEPVSGGRPPALTVWIKKGNTNETEAEWQTDPGEAQYMQLSMKVSLLIFNYELFNF